MLVWSSSRFKEITSFCFLLSVSRKSPCVKKSKEGLDACSEPFVTKEKGEKQALLGIFFFFRPRKRVSS